MKEIYLVRHTQAEGNRYRMLQGSWDGRVTKLGKRQVEALAVRFKDIPVEEVWSSDLKRAVQTADAAARWKGLPINTSAALRELDIGPWERKFFGNVMHDHPVVGRQFIFDPENFYLEGAETYGQVRERALEGLTRICTGSEAKIIAVFTHGVAIRCIMSGITGIPLNDVTNLPIFKNTAVSKLLWDGETFAVCYMNDYSHLSQADQTAWSIVRDIRDECFRPGIDRIYYETCYADSWMSVHGSLEDYSAAVYYNAALRHHAAHPGAVMRLYQLEEPVGLIDLDTERGAEEDIGWVSLLYLKDSYRNKGYGIQLLGRAEMLYEDLGRNRLQLQVSEKNGIARAFYIREGFRTVGETDTTDGKLLLMEKNLGDHNDE